MDFFFKISRQDVLKPWILPLLKDYALFVREFGACGRNFGSYMTFNKDRKNKNKIPIVPIGKQK